jgi:hypothetical protein
MVTQRLELRIEVYLNINILTYINVLKALTIVAPILSPSKNYVQ